MTAIHPPLGQPNPRPVFCFVLLALAIGILTAAGRALFGEQEPEPIAKGAPALSLRLNGSRSGILAVAPRHVTAVATLNGDLRDGLYLCAAAQWSCEVPDRAGMPSGWLAGPGRHTEPIPSPCPGEVICAEQCGDRMDNVGRCLRACEAHQTQRVFVWDLGGKPVGESCVVRLSLQPLNGKAALVQTSTITIAGRD